MGEELPYQFLLDFLLLHSHKLKHLVLFSTSSTFPFTHYFLYRRLILPSIPLPSSFILGVSVWLFPFPPRALPPPQVKSPALVHQSPEAAPRSGPRRLQHPRRQVPGKGIRGRNGGRARPAPLEDNLWCALSRARSWGVVSLRYTEFHHGTQLPTPAAARGGAVSARRGRAGWVCELPPRRLEAREATPAPARL